MLYAGGLAARLRYSAVSVPRGGIKPSASRHRLLCNVSMMRDFRNRPTVSLISTKRRKIQRLGLRNLVSSYIIVSQMGMFFEWNRMMTIVLGNRTSTTSDFSGVIMRVMHNFAHART